MQQEIEVSKWALQNLMTDENLLEYSTTDWFIMFMFSLYSSLSNENIEKWS